jgi:hypothetical protein
LLVLGKTSWETSKASGNGFNALHAGRKDRMAD